MSSFRRKSLGGVRKPVRIGDLPAELALSGKSFEILEESGNVSHIIRLRLVLICLPLGSVPAG